MVIQRATVLRGFVAFVAITFTSLQPAWADVDWIIQPSTVTNFQIQIGSTDENNNIVELYNGVQQTDSGTGLAPGFTNGLQTTTVGTLHSIGNSFLSSLNFGDRPSTPTLATAQTVIQNNGTWLPATDGSGTAVQGFYGTPTPQNMAVALVPVPGFPQNATDGGRVSISDGFSNISSGTGAGHVANPAAVDASGHFDASTLATTGQLNFWVNYNGNNSPLFLELPASGTTTESTPDTTAFIGRGTGANSYQYVLNVNLPPTVFAQTGASTQTFLTTVSTHLVAAANLVPGDVTFDGIVNGQDIAAIASHWLNTNAAKLGTGDATGDGIVNGQDIATIASHWLATTATLPGSVVAPISQGFNGGGGASVPEPGTWALLAVGSCLLFLARRR